ncbi:MAG: TonB-dependent receptor plug domain-containing protein, partial [Flavobacteriaceae bacterium]|nr:TonB-dependent receptor plug domain-containing protein [Flavobacteriaceae bacterium]
MKYFLRLIYVTVIGCLPLFSIAQEVFVYDADTKEPLAGVLVYNKDQSIRFLTALDGRCVLNGYSAKETLYINHSSYIEYRTNVKQWVQRGRVVYLQRNAFELDEVVMSVSKWEQQRKDVPQKIVGINAQSIAFNQPQTAADMLQQTGKVYVQKSQLGGGSPMIRGFAANRLLLSVDGVRMNNAIFRGGNLQNSIAVDPFSIKNTEVIFGSGSVIYGSDAIGGVVHYYTKEPQ